MAKLPFQPNSVGKYKRVYDSIDEANEEKLDVDAVLSWMKKPIPEIKEEEKSKNRIRSLLEAGVELEGLDGIPALAALKSSSKKGMLLGKAWEVLKDLYYAGRDLLSTNRVKTSLTIIGSVAAGAAIGAVLGTLVFPAIGTAIGGAVGAALTAGVAAIGGTVGLSILGAFVGSIFGKKVSNKAFKNEKRFEVSKRITNKIKKQTGVSSKAVQVMNGYLYNRRKAVEHPLLQKYYKDLRVLAVHEASPAGMEKAARFFCNELLLLEKELEKNKEDEQLKSDIQAVVYVLKKLKAADKISHSAKSEIAKTFKAYTDKQGKLPVVNPQQGVNYDSDIELSQEVVAKSTGRFLESLPSEVKSIETQNTKFKKGDIGYRYRIQTKDGGQLPEVQFKNRQDKPHHVVSRVSVKASEVTPQNQRQVSQVIVAQMRAHYETLAPKPGAAPKKEVTINAAGNDDLAVELMVAVIQSGLTPKLSDKEYPKNNPEAEQRRLKILARVKELTSKSPTLKKNM